MVRFQTGARTPAPFAVGRRNSDQETCVRDKVRSTEYGVWGVQELLITRRVVKGDKRKQPRSMAPQPSRGRAPSALPPSPPHGEPARALADGKQPAS